MSKKLYLYRPGQPGKPSKLAFTADDLPILKQWYEYVFKIEAKPEFKDLEIHMIEMFAKSISYKIYKLAYRWIEFKTTIKNFFRWKKNTGIN